VSTEDIPDIIKGSTKPAAPETSGDGREKVVDY